MGPLADDDVGHHSTEQGTSCEGGKHPEDCGDEFLLGHGVSPGAWLRWNEL